jgi:hypothetical protein
MIMNDKKWLELEYRVRTPLLSSCYFLFFPVILDETIQQDFPNFRVLLLHDEPRKSKIVYEEFSLVNQTVRFRLADFPRASC